MNNYLQLKPRQNYFYFSDFDTSANSRWQVLAIRLQYVTISLFTDTIMNNEEDALSNNHLVISLVVSDIVRQ